MLVCSRVLSSFKPSPVIRSGLLLPRHPPYTMAPTRAYTSGLVTPNQNTSDIEHRQSLALCKSEDDPDVRRKYRPFILSNNPKEYQEEDWVNTLELTTVMNIAQNDLQQSGKRLKVLVLYGSLRKRSYSRLVAYEACRILFRLGCDVRVFDPEGLPVKNDTDHEHPKVQELRELSVWSDGHIWVSPEQHGNLVSHCSLHALTCLVITDDVHTDRSIQKPNRLDPPEHRKRTPNPRPHPRHRSSMRRLPVVQCSQFPPYPRPMDADVHHSQSILDPQGIHALSG